MRAWWALVATGCGISADENDLLLEPRHGEGTAILTLDGFAPVSMTATLEDGWKMGRTDGPGTNCPPTVGTEFTGDWGRVTVDLPDDAVGTRAVMEAEKRIRIDEVQFIGTVEVVEWGPEALRLDLFDGERCEGLVDDGQCTPTEGTLVIQGSAEDLGFVDGDGEGVVLWTTEAGEALCDLHYAGP